MSSAPTHLFVYGTLRAEGANPIHDLLERGARRDGPATIPGRLHDAGPYPACVPGGDHDRVVGELYALDPDHAADLLSRLDRYEGFHPAEPAGSLYLRDAVTATRPDGGAVSAWVYHFNRPVEGLPRIEHGDWIRWLEEKAGG